jgi:hypothetical protein
MSKHDRDITDTSRRNFTKAMVTVAVATPIASLVNKSVKAERLHADDCPVDVKPRTGYTEITFKNESTTEEHIPPVDLNGGGSLTFDSRNQLQHSGSSPYVYVEQGVSDDCDLYGEIKSAYIISELDKAPWLTVSRYVGFLPGTQLLLWYQKISPEPQGNDTTFPPVSYPDNDPDIRIVGGNQANKFRMVVKTKKFKTDKSHKENKPYRFKHGDGGSLGRKFRIGQWRFVDSGNRPIVEDKGAESYNIYLTFDDFQCSRRKR